MSDRYTSPNRLTQYSRTRSLVTAAATILLLGACSGVPQRAQEAVDNLPSLPPVPQGVQDTINKSMPSLPSVSEFVQDTIHEAILSIPGVRDTPDAYTYERIITDNLPGSPTVRCTFPKDEVTAQNAFNAISRVYTILERNNQASPDGEVLIDEAAKENRVIDKACKLVVSSFEIAP